MRATRKFTELCRKNGSAPVSVVSTNRVRPMWPGSDPLFRQRLFTVVAKSRMSHMAICLVMTASSTVMGGDAVRPVDESLIAVTDRLSSAYRQAVALAQPSVVTVLCERRKEPDRLRADESMAGSNGRRLQGDLAGQTIDRPRLDNKNQELERGYASGVIVSSDGHILTSNHVVAESEQMAVRLFDNTTYPARVVGVDAMTDIAVVKIERAKLNAAEFADSDSVRVGDLVLAIGGPFGLDHTVTNGMISAKHRSVRGVTNFEDFLQTDAAMNPGNSGGPLVNMRGQIVGINTAIVSHSGTNSGVGFAIPANIVKSIADSLIKNGHFPRGYLGTALQDLTPELSRSFHFTQNDGALVGDVSKGGPAEKAGIEPGDIIVQFNTKPIGNSAQLRSLVAQTAPHSKVHLGLFRAGVSRTIPVQLDLFDPKIPQATVMCLSLSKLGLTVQDLSVEIARQSGNEDRQEGVLVRSVEIGNSAELAGLRANDVITAVNDTKISNMQDFQDVLAKSDLVRGFRLQVKTEKINHFVFVHVDDK